MTKITKKAFQPLLRLSNIQFFNDKTLYELKQNLSTIGQQLQKTEGELAQKAIDPSASMEDIQALQKSKSDLRMRFDVIKEQHDNLEAEQKAKFAAQAKSASQGDFNSISDPAQQKVKAKAEMIRAAIRQQPLSNEYRQALGDNNTTGGEKFLPKTVSTDIITEPLVKNPLRAISTVTQITNLEIPKLAFTLDDDDFIADTLTAKELALSGDSVSFGRHKFKVFAGVSETVLNGSDANLVAHVDNALSSGVAAKEKKVAFAAVPKVGEEHMSFYSTQNAVVEVEGETMYKAIKAAIADLHEDYRENAKIVMSFQAYSDIIEVLANGNATLYTAQPEQILGKPVVFVDAATKPIVGDFSYSHFNYDLNTLYDRDKDVKTGVELFVITAWLDHQLKLKSAFRIAKVTPAI